MEDACTNLTDVVRSVQLLTINGYSMTKTIDSDDGCIKSRWNIYGYDWEIHLYPAGLSNRSRTSLALKLVFVDEARTSTVRASLACQLVDPQGNLNPFKEERQAGTFKRAQDSSSPVFVMEMAALERSAYLKDDSYTVQCTITVLKETSGSATSSVHGADVPSSDLRRHLGELLRGETGADVTFLVSGESFTAHKAVLAARSPVLMAEFFGETKEETSPRVKVKDMEPEAFRSMLHFVYTDTAPELDQTPETVVVMARRLLAAADRYGLDRLRLICERKLSDGIGVDTAATTQLVLAEQRGCSMLKAKCLEFIVSTPEILDAVMATEGYKELEASCPSVLRQLLKSARGRMCS
ncbi:BTB/POZ and MATH domain-containing protein 1-like [Aegilops tauschii subsp. strangulata]|uniref:BTB/POZ and MATH domain-containing protein 1-like n=1 Tax=Aegilops tauschii subsp. strangulata TaxID=200361 RepID=UPI00098AD9DF